MVEEALYLNKPTCPVCGGSVYSCEVPPLLFRGTILHFKCRHCLEYFARDTERFLREGATRNPCYGTTKESHGRMTNRKKKSDRG